jgi:predicted signal transduction protein with EAL and GGDEF domain
MPTKAKPGPFIPWQKNEELKYPAMHDDLTGLYNIRFMYQDLKTRIKDRDKKFSILFMDMDNFKTVVDTYGRLNGSQDLPELPAKADALMFEVKNKGKNAIGVSFRPFFLQNCYFDNPLS